MEPLLIFTTAFIVGFSGALMPGPVTAVTAEHALKKGFLAAPLVTLGHAVIEILMVILLAAGLGAIIDGEGVAGVIGIAGGVVLAWMGFGMVKAGRHGSLSLNSTGPGSGHAGGPLAAGVLATLANPYWFLWWATIGAGYVALSREFGWQGVLLFFSGHILADLASLSVLAGVLVTGKRFITDRLYNGIVAVLGVFLIALAVYFCRTGAVFLFRLN